MVLECVECGFHDSDRPQLYEVMLILDSRISLILFSSRCSCDLLRRCERTSAAHYKSCCLWWQHVVLLLSNRKHVIDFMFLSSTPGKVTFFRGIWVASLLLRSYKYLHPRCQLWPCNKLCHHICLPVKSMKFCCQFIIRCSKQCHKFCAKNKSSR